MADMTSITVVLPSDLAQRVQSIADKNERKRVAEIRLAIREYVERHEAETEKAA